MVFIKERKKKINNKNEMKKIYNTLKKNEGEKKIHQNNLIYVAMGRTETSFVVGDFRMN